MLKQQYNLGKWDQKKKGNSDLKNLFFTLFIQIRCFSSIFFFSFNFQSMNTSTSTHQYTVYRQSVYRFLCSFVHLEYFSSCCYILFFSFLCAIYSFIILYCCIFNPHASLKRNYIIPFLYLYNSSIIFINSCESHLYVLN